MPNARINLVLADAQIEESGEQWIEVIPAVEEDRNGPYFFTVTEDDLATYAQSIESQPGLIQVDYDHAANRGTEAAGWFTGETQIVIAGGATPRGETQDHASLWARVKWTPRAAQEIRDGVFKRLSPEFDFENRDAKTGLLTKARNILASTLTNRPHFRQLAPVIATDLGEDELASLATDFGMTPDKVTALLARVAETQGGETAATEGDEMPTDLQALASALGLAEDATEEQIIAAAKAAKEKATPRKPDAALAAVRDALGLDENAEEAAVIVAARAAREAAVRLDTADDELETLRGADAENKTLKDRVQALENERLADKTKRILAEAIREGQVLPAEKAVLAKAFAGNPDGLLEIVATRPKRQFAAIGVGGGDGNESESVRSTRQRFDSKEADGVDPESATLHVRAEQILAEQGKRVYTDLEYAEALELASVDA